MDKEHQGQINKENVIKHLSKGAARSFHPNFINSPGDLAVT